MKGNNHRLPSIKLRFVDGGIGNTDLIENIAIYPVDISLSLESPQELVLEDRRKNENNRFQPMAKRCSINMARWVTASSSNGAGNSDYFIYTAYSKKDRYYYSKAGNAIATK